MNLILSVLISMDTLFVNFDFLCRNYLHLNPDIQSSNITTLMNKNDLIFNSLSYIASPTLTFSRVKNYDAAISPLRYSEGINLGFTIFSTEKISNLYNSYIAYENSRVNSFKTHASSFYNLADAYYALFADFKLLQSSYENQKISDFLMGLTKEKLRNGLSDSLEYEEAVINMQNARVQVLKNKLNILKDEMNIREMLLLSMDTVVIPVESEIIPDDTVVVNNEKPVSFEEQTAGNTYNSGMFNRWMKIFSILPEVGFSIGYDYTGEKLPMHYLNDFTRSRVYTLSVDFSPFFYMQKNVDAALQQKQYGIMYKKARLSSYLEYSNALSRLNLLKQDFYAKRAKLELEHAKFAMIKEKYRLGEIDMKRVMDEQASLLQAEYSYHLVVSDIKKLHYYIKYLKGEQVKW